MLCVYAIQLKFKILRACVRACVCVRACPRIVFRRINIFEEKKEIEEISNNTLLSVFSVM